MITQNATQERNWKAGNKMNTKIHLVDRNESVVKAWKTEFITYDNVQPHQDDIMNWAEKVDVFVSASNSLMFFDGGSDIAYQQIFDNVDQMMKEWIRQYNFKDEFGGYFFPVGAATIRPIKDKRLICCPTMLLPQDVSETENAYHAFKLILEVIDKQEQKIKSVLIPGLCCGYGKMSPEVSAKQMRAAYDDHMAGKKILDTTSRECRSLVYNPTILRMQPKVYSNTQFFKIDISEILETLNKNSAIKR